MWPAAKDLRVLALAGALAALAGLAAPPRPATAGEYTIYALSLIHI